EFDPTHERVDGDLGDVAGKLVTHPLEEPAGRGRRLFDEDAHGEAPDQTERPGWVVAHQPVPRPRRQYPFRLPHAGRNANQPVRALRRSSEFALPRARLPMSGHSTEPLHVVHVFIPWIDA